MTYKLNIDWPTFLNTYWQKKPVVLRQAFPHFVDPISSDELAGLALEDEIDSRLIRFQDNEWEVKNGPFTHFNDLGDDHWALLVQAVNHWHEEAATLVTPFKVLPDWRFDDLMVSLSAPQGTVGPHIDQYDVFIIQGSGKRRWMVGDKNQQYKQVCLHPSLLHIEDFDPIIDEILTAGDIIYIPPGFPHSGITLETAMSFSVGFRAMNAQNLISDLADYLIENDLGTEYYADPELTKHDNCYEILPEELKKTQRLMQAVIQDKPIFTHWFGKYISQSRHELNIIMADPPFTEQDVIKTFQNGGKLQRVLGLRTLMIDSQLFTNGDKINVTGEQAHLLAKSTLIDWQSIEKYSEDKQFIDQLMWLVNEGYWYFIE